MTAGPRCGGRPCSFWTGPGPRGCSDGCPVSPPWLPRPPSGPGTGPPGAGGGPWPRGRALLATGWWRGAWARKRRPRPRRDRTCNRTSSGCNGRAGCASLAPRPPLPPGRRPPRPAAWSATYARAAPLFRATDTPLYRLASTVVGMVIGVWWGLRHPRRLTVLAIASESYTVVFYVPWVARAVQRRRPRIAAGWALVMAGSVARLRAASAEPLR